MTRSVTKTGPRASVLRTRAIMTEVTKVPDVRGVMPELPRGTAMRPRTVWARLTAVAGMAVMSPAAVMTAVMAVATVRAVGVARAAMGKVRRAVMRPMSPTRVVVVMTAGGVMSAVSVVSALGVRSAMIVMTAAGVVVGVPAMIAVMAVATVRTGGAARPTMSEVPFVMPAIVMSAMGVRSPMVVVSAMSAVTCMRGGTAVTAMLVGPAFRTVSRTMPALRTPRRGTSAFIMLARSVTTGRRAPTVIPLTRATLREGEVELLVILGVEVVLTRGVHDARGGRGSQLRKSELLSDCRHGETADHRKHHNTHCKNSVGEEKKG